MARLIELIKRLIRSDEREIIAYKLENILHKLENKSGGDYPAELLDKAKDYIEKLKRLSYDEDRLGVFEIRYNKITIG